MDPKDFYIWVGITATTVMAFSLVVSFYGVVIYDEIADSEVSINQMNGDLLRGNDAVRAWQQRNQ